MDVFERTLYNGFLSGVGMSGDRYFYPNPLAADGTTPFNQGERERAPWFDCSCCPVNIVRFIPSLSGYLYAQRDNSLYVNLYVGGKVATELPSTRVVVKQTTEYPWKGNVVLSIDPETEGMFTVLLRLPGWAQGKPIPSDLYSYVDDESPEIPIRINGETVDYRVEKGYAVFDRLWKKGDRVEIEFPIPVRRVKAHPKVEADQGRVAFERGPIVYCAEGIDHQGHVENLVLSEPTVLTPEWRSDLLNGVTVLTGGVERKSISGNANATLAEVPFMAIPYYAWNHRGPCEMAVWLPEDEAHAVLQKADTEIRKEE